MRESYIGAGSRKLHFQQWGNGSRLLICFHGYSNNAGIFSALGRNLEAGYTTISIDLPFHGGSCWDGLEPLSRQELAAMLLSLMEQKKADRIYLAGFSLGGRICLSVMEVMPEKIAGVYLMAPDGLIPNPVHWAVTKPALGRRFFEGIVRNPEKHLKVVDWLTDRGWVHPSRQQFVHHFLSSQYSRTFLYNVWNALQDLVPSRKKILSAIKHYSIPLHLFMGKWDRIIPPANALKFAKNNPEIKIHVLDKGHRVLDDETAEMIAKLILPAR